MKANKVFGLLGAALLFVGVFAPIVRFPLMGSMSLMTKGNEWGYALLALAAISFVLTIFNKYVYLWFCGGASFAVLIIKITQLSSILKEASESINQLGKGPFKALGAEFEASVQIQWGWAVLFLGAACLIAAAATKARENAQAEFDGQTPKTPFARGLEWLAATPARKWGLLGGLIGLALLAGGAYFLAHSGQCEFGAEEWVTPSAGFTTHTCRIKDDTGTYRKQGLSRDIYANGTIRSEGMFVDDKMEGLWTMYYENGKPMQEIEFSKSQLNGTFYTWYENGQKRMFSKRRNNELVGPFSAWNEKGQLLEGSVAFGNSLLGCDNEVPLDCYKVGMVFLKGTPFMKSDLPTARKFLEKSCDLDEGQACSKLLDWECEQHANEQCSEEEIQASPYFIKRVRLEEKKCLTPAAQQNQDETSDNCYRAGEDNYNYFDKSLGLQLLKRACKAGSQNACDLLHTPWIR